MRSKKERAFYAQLLMLAAYVTLRAFRADLAGFDSSFTLCMSLLASYVAVQGAVDFKHGQQPPEPPRPKIGP